VRENSFGPIWNRIHFRMDHSREQADTIVPHRFALVRDRTGSGSWVQRARPEQHSARTLVTRGVRRYEVCVGGITAGKTTTMCQGGAQATGVEQRTPRAAALPWIESEVFPGARQLWSCVAQSGNAMWNVRDKRELERTE
jgi:hypothetical protein